MVNEDRCCYKGCKDELKIFYYGKGLCDKHWQKLCEKSTADMKKILEIKEKNENKKQMEN
jgi:hypothetical protein